MALENVMRVDGGHIVTGGGAGGNSVEIDWEDWCKLTPEEQETGDWTIINCPWADGNVSVDLMTKLWENPNPGIDFAGQDLNLDLSGYDLILVITTLNISALTINAVGNYINLNEAAAASSGFVNRRRIASITATGIAFDSCYYAVSSSSGTVNNSLLKPYIIYGIKLTASVKINAIAMDVSTSADKCMMSENESVKDRIDSVYAIETVTITSYNTLANAYTCPTDGYVRISDGNIGLLTKDSINYWTILQNIGNTKLAGIFVKKGSKIVVFNSSVGTSPGNAVFVKMST